MVAMIPCNFLVWDQIFTESAVKIKIFLFNELDKIQHLDQCSAMEILPLSCLKMSTAMKLGTGKEFLGEDQTANERKYLMNHTPLLNLRFGWKAGILQIDKESYYKLIMRYQSMGTEITPRAWTYGLTAEMGPSP